MQRALVVHPLRPGAAEAHARWCDELRRRRDEFGASRRDVGITRHVSWCQPDQGIVVTRIDAQDPLGALEASARSDTRFDQWYRSRELEVHPFQLGAPAPSPEVLVDHVTGAVDPFDLFIAVAFPVLPGRTEAYRSVVADRAREGGALERMRRWGVRRMAMWLQPVPLLDGASLDEASLDEASLDEASLDDGSSVGGPSVGGSSDVASRDVVVYELAGDVPRMITALAADPSPEMVGQRELLREAFGVDTQRVGFPMPIPAFSWSSDDAVDDPPAIGRSAPAAD